MHEQCQTVVYVLDAVSARTSSIKMSAETAMRSVTELLYVKRDAVVGTVIPRNNPYFLPVL